MIFFFSQHPKRLKDELTLQKLRGSVEKYLLHLDEFSGQRRPPSCHCLIDLMQMIKRKRVFKEHESILPDFSFLDSTVLVVLSVS